MSVHVSSLVWKCQTITSTQKIVLLALADYSNDEGKSYPGKSALAAKTSLSKRALDNTVIQLAKLKFLDVLLNSGKSRTGGTTNLYQINLEKLSIDPPAPNAPPPHDMQVHHVHPPCNLGSKPPAPRAPNPSLDPSLDPLPLFELRNQKILKPPIRFDMFSSGLSSIGIPTDDLHAIWLRLETTRDDTGNWYDGNGRVIANYRRYVLMMKQEFRLPSQMREQKQKNQKKDDVTKSW